MIIQRRKNYITELELEGKDAAEISVNEYKKDKSLPRIIHNHENEEQNRVSFDPEVVITRIIHHEDYTREEKMRYWYPKSEFAQMRKNFHQIGHLVIADELEQKEHRDNEHCLRGLENFIDKRALERKKIINKARKEVLREQATQRSLKERKRGRSKQKLIRSVEEAIAGRYRLLSKYCALEAHNVGLTDEVAAFSILSSERKMITAKLQSNKTKKLNEGDNINKVNARNKLQQDRRGASFIKIFKKGSKSFRKRFSLNLQ
mmetsp:Transcript_38006/g.43393  ORF Transcript_38006/g.43393 Transcript_38006/m.43393 type:complete len:261 (+) Transcript_38006:442-1224(+)|eukprot:CAMPEP_0194142586 /NCGR_PEP_ID=MMETSP0152-20130528/11818_1 /TAXON_ID=1049557 /ORGANISM="Thalassiothrix antarctica, Strain L6-D1" /LENGTH=260 /DNA_ID=CAMNT_0038841593 /DNA_START=366 /DNA_END=1148 /DNA_ORIENTATION=+